MDRGADIISLASRRRVRQSVRPPARLRARRGRGWGALALVGAGLAFVISVAASGVESGNSIQDLPAADRSALYERSLVDVDRACTLPGAHDGALRDHCLRQAQFLTLFPECDARCQRLAASILPHARR